jgi:hypothetical protein
VSNFLALSWREQVTFNEIMPMISSLPPATKPSRVDKERVKQVLGKYLPVMVTPTTGHFSSRARFQMHLYSKIHLNGPYQETPLL